MALECLVDNNISELPVNVFKILRHRDITIVRNSNTRILSGSEIGACISDDVGNQYIIYDDEMPENKCRVTIAHELGHLRIGHKITFGYCGRNDPSQRKEEDEADLFASHLLAPSCVLWGLSLHTAEEISKICDIPYTAAVSCANRMEYLYKRNEFLKDDLEYKVFNQFRDYIDYTKKLNSSS